MEGRRRKTTDLTTGSPIRKILLFSLPLVGGTLFQQLYSFVDTTIVGRFLGTEALAAVGSTYALNFLILGFVQGSCVGFGIPIAERFGAKDEEGLQHFLWNGWWCCIFLSVILTAGTLLFTKPLLRLIDTPEDIFDLSVRYITVIFAGISATILYNFSASSLRALGDSRHPFYFLLFTSMLNIVLDLLFILPFRMGVFGAALATVLSQLTSGLLNSFWLYRRTAGIRISRKDMPLSGRCIKRLCLVGLPMGLEYSISAIGAVVMQDAINMLGSAVVAAQTAGERIRQMFTLPMESVGMAMASYTGQNAGAERFDRIRAGIRDGLIIAGVYSLAAFLAIFLIKGWAVDLVLGETGTAIRSDAVLYLSIISRFFIFHGALMIFRNTLQGMGHSTMALASGLCELLGRSAGSALSVSFGFYAICYANPIAWALAAGFCATAVSVLLRKQKRRSESAC